MSLYGQEPEARLLTSFLARLEHRSVVDIGAERGAFAEELLRGGADQIYAIEPEPRNAEALRDRFRDPRVKVLELAASDTDGELSLHLSSAPSGEAITFGHTLLDRPDTDEIAWKETVLVQGRSLSSLVSTGELPARVGIVKIDTEGHDLAVVSGMGELDCDVLMVEHWVELPHSLGPCPWSTEEMVAALRDRGFSHFAFVVHRGEFVFMLWDDARLPVGAMGNVVFLHDRAVDRLLPDVLRCASDLAAGVVELGLVRANAASTRLEVIHSLEHAKERAAKAARKAATQQHRQAKITEEQLAEIREAVRQRDEIVEGLKSEHDLQAEAAAERLAVIEELTKERDLQAEAAEERLALIGRLRRSADPAPPPWSGK